MIHKHKPFKRLFLAFSLPNPHRTFLQELANQNCLSTKARWVPTQNLHITACFIGEKPLSYLPDLVNFAENLVLNTHEFFLFYEQLMLAPKKQAYMLWATYKPEPAFNDLYRSLADFCGVKTKNDHKIHVTLARFKPSETTRLSCTSTFHTPIKISELVLYESVLKPSGAEYVPLKKFVLNEKDSF